jgi:hypothetical protein
VTFDPGSPFTGPELVRALQRMVDEGGGYLSSLADDVFFRRQGAGWSPAEHVRHLRKGSAPLALALRLPPILLRLRFGMHQGASRPFHELRTTYLTALAAGGQAGRYAPSAEPAPLDPGKRRGEIMTSWREVTQDLCKGASRWDEKALDAAQGPHPLLGNLSLREMLEFTVYHTTHHLRIVADRVRAGV